MSHYDLFFCSCNPEHKLFVGMLPKNVSEAELSDLFSTYGVIKDIQILRGSQQTSKGTSLFNNPDLLSVCSCEALNCTVLADLNSLIGRLCFFEVWDKRTSPCCPGGHQWKV